MKCVSITGRFDYSTNMCRPPFRRTGVGLVALVCLTPLFGQTPYPPISRNTEHLEKSWRSRRHADMAELQRDLEEAREASDALVTLGKSVLPLLDSFSDGSLNAKEFKKQISAQMKEARGLTRPIDEIAYLDPTKSADRPEYRKAASLVEFLELVDEFSKLAEATRQKVKAFYGYGVSVDYLRGPALSDLTGNLKQLTKMISSSTGAITLDGATR